MISKRKKKEIKKKKKTSQIIASGFCRRKKKLIAFSLTGIFGNKKILRGGKGREIKIVKYSPKNK